MNSRRTMLVLLAAVLVIGAVCRWEEWTYTDRGGAVVFRFRGVLLPWQEVAPPPPGSAVNATVQKWTYCGFNRSDYTGPPVEVPTVTTRGGVPAR